MFVIDTIRMVQVEVAFNPSHKCLGQCPEMFQLPQSVQQTGDKTIIPTENDGWPTSNIRNVKAVTMCNALSPEIRCRRTTTAWKDGETIMLFIYIE
jgi:hypothetical protein